jgi:hypothetical protein
LLASGVSITFLGSDATVTYRVGRTTSTGGKNMNCRGCALVFLICEHGRESIVQQRSAEAAEYVSGRRRASGSAEGVVYVSMAGGRIMQGCGGSAICEHGPGGRELNEVQEAAVLCESMAEQRKSKWGLEAAVYVSMADRRIIKECGGSNI